MTRKTAGNSRLLALVALLTAVAGCDTNSTRNPGTQFATPVVPTAIQITISSDRSSIRAGTTTSALITWSAIFVPQGTPVPNGTIASVSTSLGSLNSLGGGNSAEIEMFGGTAQVRLFAPTTGTGTARVRVEIDGVVAVVEVTITTEAGPPVPAPTAATITLGADTLVVLEVDGSTLINLIATVLGSDADPFNNAPVQFSAPIGTFSTSGSSTSDIVGTESDGTAAEALTVGPDFSGVTGSTFNVTATLFTVGGGTKSATVTIALVRADDPPVPTTLQFVHLPDSTVQRASGAQVTTLQATVLDQYGDPFEGVNVTFTTELATISGGSVAANIDETDGDGLATVTLTNSEADLDAFVGSSFDTTAGTPTIAEVSKAITISGTSDPTLVPTNVELQADFTAVLDNGSPDADIGLDAFVTDQFGDPLTGVTVTFTVELGTLDGSAFVVTNGTGGVASTTFDLTASDKTNHPTNSFKAKATITTPSGTDFDEVTFTIVRPPQADFAFSGTSGTSVVNFDDNSTGGPTSWAWDFDSSTTVESTVQNPTFNYGTSGFACAGAGGCSATLTVTNAAGFSTITKFVPLPLP